MKRSALTLSYLLREVQRLNRVRWAMGGGLAVTLLALRPILQAWWGLATLLGLFLFLTSVFDLLHRSVSRLQEDDPHKASRRLTLYFHVQVFCEVLLILCAIHWSGGLLSPISLIYLLYIGMMAVVFPPRQQAILTLYIVVIYILLAESYIRGWWQPMGLLGERPFTFPISLMRTIEISFAVSFVLCSLLVTDRAQQLHRAWVDAAEKGEFLNRLNELMQRGLTTTDLQTLCQMLSDRIGEILRPDSVYIDAWDENTQTSVLMASYGLPLAQDFMGGASPCVMVTTYMRLGGGPLVIEDTHTSPHFTPEIVDQTGMRSVLALPIYRYPDRVYWGSVLICYRKKHMFSSQEIQRVQQVADIVALLISHMHLYREVFARVELLEEFSLQVTRLTSDLRHTALLPGIVESARSLLKAQRAALFLWDAEKKHLTCSHAICLSDEYIQGINLCNRPVLEMAACREGVVLVPDVTQDFRSAELVDVIRKEGFCSYGLFMLPSPDGPRGVLAVYWDRVHAISMEEVTIARLFAERASDVLRNADLYAQVAEESLTDELTGLPNRRALDRQLAYESARSFRIGRPFTLIMADLDGFKSINDNFGHPIGDSVLQQVATALRRSVRTSDFVSRYGGDEFAIILPETHLHAAQLVAEKLRQSLSVCGFRMPNATQRYVSACMGLAVFPVDTNVPAQLIEVADRRLYRAKRLRWGTIIMVD